MFGVPRLPVRPCDERPPAMYGHFCLVQRVSVHDRYYCSPVAKHILPIVNPEMFTIARFFGLKYIHIVYSNILSFVGIQKVAQLFLLANFFY